MQCIRNPLTKLGVATLLALTALYSGQAADKPAADGTWQWTSPGRSGGPERKMTLELKVEGEKVTGTLIAPGRDGQTNKTEIAEGKLKGDEISFTVTREFGGNKMVSKYIGKVSADAIKGKIEFERNGEKQSRDWEAKREAGKK